MSIKTIFRTLLALAVAVTATACNDDSDHPEKYDTQYFQEGALITQVSNIDGTDPVQASMSYVVTWHWDRNVADVTFQGLSTDGLTAPQLSVASVPFTLNSDGTRTISGTNLPTYQNGVQYPLMLRSLTIKAIDRFVTEETYIYPLTTFPQLIPSVYVEMKVDDKVVSTMPRILYYFGKTSVAPADAPEQAIYNSDYLPTRVELHPETMLADVQIFYARLYTQQQEPANTLITGLPFTIADGKVTVDMPAQETVVPQTFTDVTYIQSTGQFTLNNLKAVPELPLTAIAATVNPVGRMRLAFTCSPTLTDKEGAFLTPSAFALDGYLLPQD